MDIRKTAWLWAFVGLSLLDAGLTIYGIQTGKVHEANPVWGWMLNGPDKHFSVFFLLKGLIPYIVGHFLSVRGLKWSVALFTLVCVWNTILILTAN